MVSKSIITSFLWSLNFKIMFFFSYNIRNANILASEFAFKHQFKWFKDSLKALVYYYYAFLNNFKTIFKLINNETNINQQKKEKER